MNIAAVDLFCGAGGLAYGLQSEGIEVVAGIDVDEDCKYPFEQNTGGEFFSWDIQEINGDKIDKLFPDGARKVMVGCAPCQPFSQYTQGSNARTDEKWGLLQDFSRLTASVEPSIVSMENVPELSNHAIFDEFVQTLRDELDYSVWFDEIHAPKYGVPQDRNRLVLLASKLGDIKLEDPQHGEDGDSPTVHDAIGELPDIPAGGVAKSDPFHRAAGLNETNLKRIRNSNPGGTWHDWPEELKLDCHKKSTGDSYVGVYGRMAWDEPAPTITTQFFNYGSGRFGHPEQDRAISLREGALLQTFPKKYQFVPNENEISKEHAGQMIGNAVPVELAKAIGRSIRHHLCVQLTD